MSYIDRIVVDAKVIQGKPLIKGATCKKRQQCHPVRTRPRCIGVFYSESKAKGLGWRAIYIRSDAPPQILHSVPNDICKSLKGTRIPVYIVLNLMGGGLTAEDVLREYPDLTKEDVMACLEYAARLVQEGVGVLEPEEVR